ncbi:MAG: trypsin-like peptidase domain-containing protein, partial [Acidobacteria bacterium]|nr:trypsin-like peptidase domain-containing protein [Acidobacteriota bacterium]
MIQISVRQLVLLGLVSALIAAGLVIGYDRYVDQPTEGAESAPASAQTPISNPTVVDDERNNIDIYRAVSPGVVNIRTITPVRDFFAVYEAEGGGSGSVIDEKGHILTNYHVVQGAAQLYVTMSDGSEFEARRIGNDPDSDLAIIKIDAGNKRLTVVRMGDSDHLV